jgi:hypothetical protein
MIPTKWTSAYDCAHVGPNMKFVTEEKPNESSYIMAYEIFTTMDVSNWSCGI